MGSIVRLHSRNQVILPVSELAARDSPVIINYRTRVDNLKEGVPEDAPTKVTQHNDREQAS